MHRELLRAVWGPEYGEETEYLRVYIRYLRQKLEPDPSKPRYILTQPGAGYMLHQPDEDRERKQRRARTPGDGHLLTATHLCLTLAARYDKIGPRFEPGQILPTLT